MCFSIETKFFKPKLKKAEYDITVYKLVATDRSGYITTQKNKCFPLIFTYNLIYYKNKLNPHVPIKIKKREFVTIFPLCTVWRILEGYHSYKIVASLSRLNSVNAMFVIPKGTKYLYDKESGEYVSENIIFKDWIKHEQKK